MIKSIYLKEKCFLTLRLTPYTAINNVKSLLFELKYYNFDSYIVWTLTYVIPFDYNFD